MTGPSHLPPLLRISPRDSEEVAKFKRAFGSFFDWFLRHRYVRHLAAQGKMINKQAYIDYKNKHLIGYPQDECLGLRTKS